MEDGNNDADAALILEFFDRGMTQLQALAKTDPEKAIALTQAWIERIHEIEWTKIQERVREIMTSAALDRPYAKL